MFFNLRNEFFDLAGGAWTNAIIVRSDRALLRTRPRLGGKVGILTRVDLPIKDLAEWLDETAARSGVSQGRIIRDALEKVRSSSNRPAFMRLAGSVRGPRNLSRRKGFSSS